MNASLLHHFTVDEVTTAFFEMSPDKSLGVDGMLSIFFFFKNIGIF